MEKKKKLVTLVIVIMIAAVAVAAVAVGAFYISRKQEKDHRAAIAGQISAKALARKGENVTPAKSYKIDLSPYGEENVLWIDFDTDAEAFANRVNEETAATGSYTVSGNYIEASVKNGGDSVINTIRYLLEGDYLLLEDGLYAGEIPDGDRFDAEVMRTDATGMEIRYIFSKDGSFTCLEIPEGKTESDATRLEGTYERDGNLINWTLSGNQMIPFYIYEGRLFASYYMAAEE